MLKNIKIILILVAVIGAAGLGAWAYVASLKGDIKRLTDQNTKLVQEALDKKVQYDLDTATLQNKHDSLQTLNTGLIALGVKTETVTEYVTIYKNNPANAVPCLRSEWMHTYNRAVQAAKNGSSGQ